MTYVSIVNETFAGKTDLSGWLADSGEVETTNWQGLHPKSLNPIIPSECPGIAEQLVPRIGKVVMDYSSRRRIIVLLAVCALVVTSVAVSYVIIDGNESFRGYVNIYGDGDFTKANGVSGGRGTSSDPYVIRDLNITKAPGIVIRQTDAFVRIESVIIKNISLEDAPYVVNLTGVKNIDLQNLSIEDCSGGIYLVGQDCRIMDCRFNGIPDCAMFLIDCADCNISGNQVSGSGDNGPGIVQVLFSSRCQIDHNLVECGGTGVVVGDSNNCTILENEISAPGAGLVLGSAKNAVVGGNTFTVNGIVLYGGSSEADSPSVILESNLVGNEPVFYASQADGMTVTNRSLGQLIVANCTGFIARNMTIHGPQDAIQILHSDNVTLEDISIQGVIASEFPRVHPKGIDVVFCSDFVLRDSTISSTALGVLFDGYRIVIDNNTIQSGDFGILGQGTDITISRNLIAGCLKDGVRLSDADAIEFLNNTLVDENRGVEFNTCSNLTFLGNTLNGTNGGVGLYQVSDSILHHNNFLNNTGQVILFSSTNISWDAGYPVGGNYWLNYDGVDLFSGTDQNVPGSDGLGDTRYQVDIPEDTWDNYPLMMPVPG